MALVAGQGDPNHGREVTWYPTRLAFVFGSRLLYKRDVYGLRNPNACNAPTVSIEFVDVLKRNFGRRLRPPKMDKLAGLFKLDGRLAVHG